MELISGNASGLGSMAKNRISFREDLNDTHHCDEDGFSSDFSEDEVEVTPADAANLERRALKYRQSLTMLNKLAGLKITNADVGDDDDADSESDEVSATEGAIKPTKEHLLAAKKSIDDLTAWVNAGGALDEDPFAGDDDD
ncbi:hypothetical protein BGZ76_009661 [Entomortierella beljakovae]|nr:hypothetical protein BGZ76_009661 [Entomortierella beljakovae]